MASALTENPEPPTGAVEARATAGGRQGGGIVSFLTAFPRAVVSALGGGPGGAGGTVDPRGEARRWVTRLRSLADDDAPIPDFEEEGRNVCLSRATRELRMVCVVLTTRLNPDCDRFLRELCTPIRDEAGGDDDRGAPGGRDRDDGSRSGSGTDEGRSSDERPRSPRAFNFRDFFRDNNFVLWGGDMASADAFAGADQFHAAGFPFIGVYAPRDGRLQRVYSNDGYIEGTALRRAIDGAVGVASAAVQEQRSAAAQREADRLLRREQEEAFQEAQREDEEREREKEEREEKMRLEEAVQLSKQLDAEEQLRKAREQLKPEPPHAPHTAAVPTTTLRIKLPNGEPVKRRFLSTDTIEELRRFLDVTMADRSLDIGRYEVACNVPRRVFGDSAKDTRLTMVEASLHPQAVLFVTAAPESGSDDDDGDASTPATSGGGGGGGSSRT